jgi:DNA repair protein RadC
LRKRELSDASSAFAGDAAEPHYVGHRDRLRERLREGGGDVLSDYELIEALLFAVIPRQDTKPIAKALLAEFDGNFDQLFASSRERLKKIPGVGDAVADHIALIRSVVARSAKQKAVVRETLSSWTALVDYCTKKMANEINEQFRVLFLDRKNKLLKDEVQGRGTVDHTPVYTREVVKRALDLGASAIILVHNHPSGDPTPSTSDVEMTKEIVDAARLLGVSVHDHLIIGKGRHASLKQLGLM